MRLALPKTPPILSELLSSPINRPAHADLLKLLHHWKTVCEPDPFSVVSHPERFFPLQYWDGPIYVVRMQGPAVY